jgi:hypothetical protein
MHVCTLVRVETLEVDGAPDSEVTRIGEDKKVRLVSKCHHERE